MKIALIGTYPPTRCGIATFTSDVHTSLQALSVDVEVVQVLSREECPLSMNPANGSGPLILAGRDTYAEVAYLLNDGDFDAVLIEHEFGIFGGGAGGHLLELTTRLKIPYVVTFHTVLPSFADEEARVMHSLCAGAAAITVFTSTARELLLDQRLVKRSRIRIVGHGAPMAMYSPNPDREAIRRRLGVRPAQRVVSTFGLLSEGKGIEVGIEAIANLPEHMSDVVYVVAGRTHPGVLRRDGEHYRQGLIALAEGLDLGARVIFIDRFMDVEEIADLLSISDVFLTPYRGVDQIVSGALTYALAAGCPVVSSPYRYACDMLADGAGILVPFGDPRALAAGLARMLVGPDRTSALAAARRTADGLSWPAIGAELAALMLEAVARGARPASTPVASSSGAWSRTDPALV